jgi:hypothetical protein
MNVLVKIVLNGDVSKVVLVDFEFAMQNYCTTVKCPIRFVCSTCARTVWASPLKIETVRKSERLFCT